MKLNEFIFTNDNKKIIMDCFNETNTCLIKEIQKKEESKDDNDVYYSKKQNPLFWCVYINIYGYENYIQITNKYGNIELEEKQKMMEFLKKGYSKLKVVNRRITKTMIQEWMSELMSATKISIQLLQLFSVYYKKNIIIYNEINNTYLKFLAGNGENDDTTMPMLIVKNRNNNFGIYMDTTYEKINELTKGVCLEDIDKPLNGMSSYKITELTELATKCGISCENVKKADLYGKIWNHLQSAYNK
jgi:hypothetical protein